MKERKVFSLERWFERKEKSKSHSPQNESRGIKGEVRGTSESDLKWFMRDDLREKRKVERTKGADSPKKKSTGELIGSRIFLKDYDPTAYERTTRINDNGTDGLKQAIKMKNRSRAEGVTFFVYGYSGESARIAEEMRLKQPDISTNTILSDEDIKRLIEGASFSKYWEVVSREVIIDNSSSFQGIRLPRDIKIEEVKEINYRKEDEQAKLAFTLWNMRCPTILARVYWHSDKKIRNMETICKELNSLLGIRERSKESIKPGSIEGVMKSIQQGKKVISTKGWQVIFTDPPNETSGETGETEEETRTPSPENKEQPAAPPQSFWGDINGLEDLEKLFGGQ